MSITAPEVQTMKLLGPKVDRDEELLTPEALAFISALDARFGGARAEMLAERRARRIRIANGEEQLGFREDTRAVREDTTWRVAPAPATLSDRRVEITGPPTPTMTVNALNSGARVWMADLEDATSPTWENLIQGQLTILDALDRTLDFTTAEGKRYRLNEEIATIVVRPRGWHLVDKNVLLDGRPISASLLDFGLHFFHGAKRQLAQGGVPGFYLPKLVSHHEARLWNDVFVFAQEYLDIPQGTIRATVLIETLPAAFEMEEILYELRDHASGLNAGRWDYLFSAIKYLGDSPKFVLPDRSSLTMTTPFMRAYTELLVRSCHKRGAFAIGGMAAAVPVKSNPEQFELAIEKVRADKEREAGDGFDGSWVAHPALVATCDSVFTDAFDLGKTDQRARLREDVNVTAEELMALDRVGGVVTEAGVRGNVRTSLRYLTAWLEGFGAVALDGLMEDAATVEIARTQLWQWAKHHAELNDGRHVSDHMIETIIKEEADCIRSEGGGDTESFEHAVELLRELVRSRELPRFFTTTAYARWLAPN